MVAFQTSEVDEKFQLVNVGPWFLYADITSKNGQILLR
jgi:hypothetical protein